MRILHIRFQNLNSLVGTWEIDLTHPAFASDGIFAITGPTGAGKTTILDAICLALYGRTPRLNKVSKGSNEVMSRRTGECYAEVAFETQAGRYRCHWSQSRAYRKSNHPLQPPKHEIAHADSGIIIESKLRAVAEKIEKITGMDFDRFTRSMLLAQGGFAAFLQAAPDERAPILEQITGTEIYSHISMRVHERRSLERKKLETLEAERAGIPLLSQEDAHHLNTNLAHKSHQDAKLNQQVIQKNQAILWLDGITHLEHALKQIEEQKRDWQRRQEAFAPEHERLQRAMQSLELAGDHTRLTSMRDAQKKERHQHTEHLEERPKKEEAVRRATETMRQAGAYLDNKKMEQEKTLQVLQEVRALDLKLSEKDGPIQTLGQAIFEQEKLQVKQCSKQDKDCFALEKSQHTFKTLQSDIAETQVDEGLVEHLAGILSRFNAFKSLHGQQTSKTNEINEATSQVAKATQRWHQQTKTLDTQRRARDTLQHTFDQKQIQFKETIKNHDLAFWRHSVSVLKERQSLIDRASEAVASRAESKQCLDALNNRHHTVDAEKRNISEKLQDHVEHQASLERERNLLETQLSRLKRIQSFEKSRHQLQDGEPCPLCGAKEHPFAEGNIPIPDETMSTLRKVRTNLKTTSNAVADLKVKQAEMAKDLEQIATRKKEASDKMATTEISIHQCCVALSIELDESASDLDKKVSHQQKENRARIDHETKTVDVAEAIEKEISTLRESLEKTRTKVILLERTTQDTAHKKESAQQALERGQSESEALHAQHQAMQRALQQEVSVYGIETLSTALLDPIQQRLTARRNQWMTRQKKKVEFERYISTMENQTGYQKEQIQQTDVEIKKQQRQLHELQHKRKILSDARHALLGNKNPTDEEKRLSEGVEAAEKSLDRSRQALNAATQTLETLRSQIKILEHSMAERTTRSIPMEEAFLARVRELGLADEAGYLAACLPEEVRKTLQQQALNLLNEQTAFMAQAREKTTLLETERQKQITDQPRGNLHQILTHLVAQQRVLQQEIGAMRQKLKDNETLRQRQQTQIQAIDVQKQELSRWHALHELIGSSDGKKYRNFAQGLTFEIMVGHANRQLQKMTDRYLLIMDEMHPLELNVIDSYQSDETRSTKNLSGGESFIVSLALALGLSQMASNTVRVDSLFLDEGFGTLDEEALETALETLVGLQQEGKLIGVISHVPTLKERVSTQIQVIPKTGGRSILRGPGCGRPDTLHLNVS